MNRSVTPDIGSWLESCRVRVDEALERWLPAAAGDGGKLHEAMRYSVFAGGKRIRPVLCLAVAEGLGGHREAFLRAASAIELLHTYSLIHDDLPALDNDSLRRGKPTSHKVFGEGMAILAGDALLTLAFEWMGTAGRSFDPSRGLEAVELFARVSGPAGMVGGQVLDVESEHLQVTPERLRTIHRLKTGALIRGSVEIGAILGGASPDERERFRTFGEEIGVLFQIVDDILDVEGDVSVLGKTPGSDVRKGKATFPSILGIQVAKDLADKAERQAIDALGNLGKTIPVLVELARFIRRRSN